MTVKRGEVWLARGSATDSPDTQRPCLVVSPPELIDHLSTVIVAPMINAESADAPAFHIAATVNDWSGRFLLEQVRAIDKAQLDLRVGSVDRKTLSAALRTLREMFAD